MTQPPLSGEEVQRRAEKLYQDRIRREVETENNIGKALAINVETGEYEMDADEIAAVHRALAKHPNAPLWTMRYSGPVCQDTEQTFFKLGSAPFWLSSCGGPK